MTLEEAAERLRITVAEAEAAAEEARVLRDEWAALEARTAASRSRRNDAARALMEARSALDLAAVGRPIPNPWEDPR